MKRCPETIDGEHRDEWMRGRRRARCRACGSEFPCAGDCQHLDCAAARADRDYLRAETGLP